MEWKTARGIASRMEVLDQATSTNAVLRERATDARAWPHLSVLLTEHQTAGRGRLDRVWTAPAGTALAVSVLLRNLPGAAEQRGWIPLAAGVAMADAVAAQLPGRDVAVKWPNDVLVDGGKICGILAEATGEAVIVGTGVNTSMTDAQLPVPTATSFAVLGAEADVDRLLGDYLVQLSRWIEGLSVSGAVDSGLHAAVTRACATLGRHVRVSLPGGDEIEGEAVALDTDGRLVMRVEGIERPVSAGDVVHVRPTRT